MATTAKETLAAIAATRQDFLRDCADMGAGRLQDYGIFENYLDGDQKVLLTDRARTFLQRTHIPFAENFCETIVDVHVNSLNLEGFTVESAQNDDGGEGKDADGDTPEDELAEQLGDWFERDRMDDKQDTIHANAIYKGDAFLIVDWDAEHKRPRYRFNRPEIVKPVYDPDDEERMLYAVKKWNSIAPTGLPGAAGGDPITRMNLYFPDRVEKWFSTATDGEQRANWHAWLDEGDAGWPVWWTRDGSETGEPRGIPVIHFRRKARGKCFGRSVLKGAIPQQDAFNKAVLDLINVMDFEGEPQLWATGADDAATFKRAPGIIWTAQDVGAKFGKIDGEDPNGALAAINAALSRMGARAHVPLHLLNPTGVLPSGETLKVAEAPKVAEAKANHSAFGTPWIDAARMSIILSNDFAGTSFDEDCVIKPQWDNPQSRDDESESRTALNHHELGVSAATLMAELGYNPAEESEKRAEEDQAAFDAGQLPGVGALPGDPMADPKLPAGTVKNDGPAAQ